MLSGIQVLSSGSCDRVKLVNGIHFCTNLPHLDNWILNDNTDQIKHSFVFTQKDTITDMDSRLRIAGRYMFVPIVTRMLPKKT